MTAISDSDRESIVTTALDYYEGWFGGDAARMERALHPQLAKRGLVRPPDIELDGFRDMVDATAAGLGRRKDPGEDLRIHVDVDHVHGDIATAAVTSTVFVDYLQLVRIDGAWTILNALWARA